MIQLAAPPRPKRPSRPSRSANSAPQSTTEDDLRRLQAIRDLELDWIDHPDFKKRGAFDRICGEEVWKIDVSDGPGARSAPRGLGGYMAQLYRTKLLSEDEEREAFRRMNFLKCYAARLRKKLDLQEPDREIMDEIEHCVSAAESLRNAIIQCNLRLVVSIAKKFTAPEATFDEMVSEGNMTLLRAVEKFDYSRGYRFSTYATHAVRRCFYRQFTERQKQLSRRAADGLDASVIPSDTNISEQHVHRLDRAFRQLMEMVTELDPREEQIVRARFGFQATTGKKVTLQKLAKELGVCKERIRQLEARAMKKLRKAAYENEGLRELMN